MPLETLSPTADLFSELGIPFEHSEAPAAAPMQPTQTTQTTQREQVARAAGAGLVGAATMALVAAGVIGLAVVYLAGYIFGLW